MIAAASAFTMTLIAVSLLLNLYRLWAGPDVTDRILALDTMAVNAIGLIVLAGILFGSTIYFEAALLFAMVGFISTVPSEGGHKFTAFDTSRPGNSNGGHLYGTTLSDAEKSALVEYLKVF